MSQVTTEIFMDKLSWYLPSHSG